MKFDTIIIGGGLTGLTCGINLVGAGRKCAIVSSGQSSLHFSSGTFGLYDNLTGDECPPDTKNIPVLLSKDKPEHPYVKLGAEVFERLTGQTAEFFNAAGLNLSVSGGEGLKTISPIGVVKKIWMAMPEVLSWEAAKPFPYGRVAIVNIKGFLDFYSDFLADSFKKMGVDVSVTEFSLPELETVPLNPTEMRSTNFMKFFDRERNLSSLAAKIRALPANTELVILPAVTGSDGARAVKYLENSSGKKIRLVATTPPSVPGIRAERRLKEAFTASGGIFMAGDKAVKALYRNGDVCGVYTENHGTDLLKADSYVLASGGYFSRGLVSGPDCIKEPVFDTDVYFEADMDKWYDGDLFADQPYQMFGVRTNKDFNALHKGVPVSNLWAAGSILSGYNPLQEGSGAGVSILTAMKVAENILNKTRTDETRI